MSFIGWLRSLGYKDAELDNARIYIIQLQQQLSDLQIKLDILQKKYDTDSTYYENRIKTLSQLSTSTINIPDTKWLSGKTIEIDPRAGYFPNAIISVADVTYNELTLEDWKTLLTQIKNSFSATWTAEVFDCDDFTLLFSAILTYSIYKAGFNKQVAFGIAWSDNHAFNVFIARDGNTYVYEPQTDAVIGKFRDALPTTPLNYNSYEVWFMS